MKQISLFDKLVSDKVYRRCVDCGYTKYSEIAIILGTTDSFTKAVFSSHRKKLNLYHLTKLSYELHCTVDDFLPDINDYKNNSIDDCDEYNCFQQSITKEI